MARRRQQRQSLVRPTSFKEFPPDHLDQVVLLAGMGLSDAELAETMGVTVTKLAAWRQRYRDFDEAISKGRLRIDAEVTKALYKRAVGYAYEKENTSEISGPEGTTYTTSREVVHVPPDVGAAKFWLSNRTEAWKDRKEVVVNVNLVDRLERANQRLATVGEVIDAEIVDTSKAPGGALPAPEDGG